ncbi:hypothetical protein SIAM614_14715 [Stappia aggregata IAM 12614]|uniref:Uncharacterized protein n=1 Tax=Roseibium aggregatum (strain ATCC 25650 / DSM 13394 / JCM 20685 / NBRC 16684 / NCIMB 2208 / IAM 12614 / B1) TaxID=384765 RepID=A0NSX8_ROSAI|nr:hypothetical protein SIAM614_14715 [Stappia aggregata IAM 12614] [Roseibium aggregatum IAM 12614]
MKIYRAMDQYHILAEGALATRELRSQHIKMPCEISRRAYVG